MERTNNVKRHYGTWTFLTEKLPRRAELGTIDMVIRSEITIKTQDKTGPPAILPVDITWYAANFYEEHLFNPFAKNRTVGQGYRDGDANGNWGPENLTAVVYAVPYGDSPSVYNVFEIYRHQLKPTSMDETKDRNKAFHTSQVNIPIHKRVKEYLSRGSDDKRVFELFFCIVDDARLFEARFWAPCGE